MAARRLSEAERAELEARRAALELELKLLTAELRSDAALRAAWLFYGRGLCAGRVFAEDIRAGARASGLSYGCANGYC